MNPFRRSLRNKTLGVIRFVFTRIELVAKNIENMLDPYAA
ncbi:hypothetical protein HMPREF9069_00120 [Atopobium sp. oral taxon 810 str. F0209]|nr:hypothetical protein HMPREF9069_00120 [Atopobium sp. oral taxon 810 str. F0209]